MQRNAAPGSFRETARSVSGPPPPCGAGRRGLAMSGVGCRAFSPGWPGISLQSEWQWSHPSQRRGRSQACQLDTRTPSPSLTRVTVAEFRLQVQVTDTNDCALPAPE